MGNRNTNQITKSISNKGTDMLNINKKCFELKYNGMNFMFEINSNSNTEKEEVNEIKNKIDKKYISITESKNKIKENISVNFKSTKEIDNSSNIVLNQNNNAKNFVKLVLLIFNKNPDLNHKFLFNNFSQILKNNNCLKIYEANIQKALENLKNIKNTKVSDKTNYNKLFYYSISSIISAFIADSMGSYVEFQKPSIDNYKSIWQEKNKIFGTSPGQITDDSEMAISQFFALCDSLYSPTNRVEDFLAYYYGLWYASAPFDIGITTRKAFLHFDKTLEKNGCINFSERQESQYYEKCTSAAKSLKSSLSNGFLMRHTPLTFYNFWKNEKEIISLLNMDYQNYSENKLVEINKKMNYETFYKIIDLIRPMNEKDVSITHSNSDTIFFTSFYDLIIIDILYYHSKVNEFSSKEISYNVYSRMKEYFNYFYTEILDKSLCSNDTMLNLYKFIQRIDELNSDIKNSSDLFERNKEIEKFLFSENIGTMNTGYFLHSIKLCLYFLKFYEHFDLMSQTGHFCQKSDPFEYYMFLICNLGGDTDTNCCIVGGVIGALVGFDSYNQKYVKDSMKFLPSKSQVYRPVLYSPGLSIFLALQVFKKLKESNFDEIDLNIKFDNLYDDENKSNYLESLNVILQLFFVNL